MGSAQVTLVAGTATVTPLDGPASRVVLTMISGAAETYVTVDGTAPVASTASAVAGSQVMLPPVVGAQVVVQAPMFGDHMATPTIRLLSAGTPVIELAW